MQVLFQLDYQGEDGLPMVNGFLREQCNDPVVINHARRLIDGVRQRRDALDKRIDAAAQHWSLERMPGVDRNIVRVALFEMLVCEKPPAKVAINEAIEVAKVYGTAQSPQFVNGILDAIWKAHRPEPNGDAHPTVPASTEPQGG